MRPFLAIACAALISGCVTGEKVTGLESGMSKTQVVKVLGKPTGYAKNGDTEVLQYSNKLMSGWSWDRADYQAILEKGKLVAWGTGEVRQNRPPVTPVLVMGNVTTN